VAAAPADPLLWEDYSSLRGLGLSQRFLLRHPGIEVDGDRAEVLERLRPWHEAEVRDLGFQPAALQLAEQVHGAGVALAEHGGGLAMGVDALIAQAPGTLLGIYVADCAAVHLVDPVSGAFGLVHSGRKGTELGIVAVTLASLAAQFGSRAADVRVQISPCIRPPAYEVDFAAMIRRQCLEAGVRPEHFADAGVCTSGDLRRYYSYRMEKGRTGRMLALLGKPL
jgi:copper oxidase (laccase) domain-containing protein